MKFTVVKLQLYKFISFFNYIVFCKWGFTYFDQFTLKSHISESTWFIIENEN